MNSIRTRLGLLFILFFLLITISVGATFWSLQAQAGDALLINLAGRQRMLVQLMTRLASETPSDPNAAAALAEAAAAFDATLQALIGGGRSNIPEIHILSCGLFRSPRSSSSSGRSNVSGMFTHPNWKCCFRWTQQPPKPVHPYRPSGCALLNW